MSCALTCSGLVIASALSLAPADGPVVQQPSRSAGDAPAHTDPLEAPTAAEVPSEAPSTDLETTHEEPAPEEPTPEEPSGVGRSSIVGTVRAVQDGSAAAAVQIELRCSCLRAPLAVDTADDGSYAFIDLPAGDYALDVYGMDGVVTRELTVGASEEGHLDVSVPVAAADVAEEEEPARPRRSRQERADRLVQGGVGTIMGGFVLATGGIFVAALSPCGQDGASGGGPCSEDLRVQLAISFGVIGVATMAGGATMIGIGAKRRRAAKQVGIAPFFAFDPDRATAGVVGRF